jgi:dipeptidyl aminopeptidase/acylaminoacyl peptidase
MTSSNHPERNSAGDDDRKLAEALCNLQKPFTIRLSPDGHRVLYGTRLVNGHAVDKHAKTTLWLAETGKQNSGRKLTQGLHNDCHPRWSPDGQLIAFLSDRGKEGESSAIYILPTMGEPYAITEAEFPEDIDSFEFSPDGRSILYISADEKLKEVKEAEENETDGPNVWGENWEYARLRIVDVSSKKIRCLTQDLPRHVTGATWSSDSSRIAFTHTDNTEVEEAYLTGTTLSVIEIETQQITDLTTIHNDLEDLIWNKDNHIYFYSGAPLDHTCGGFAVYSVDVSQPSVQKRAYGVDSDVEGLLQQSGEIVVQLARGINTEFHILSSNEILLDRPTGFDAWDVNLSSDTPILALALGDPDHPAEVVTIQSPCEPVTYSNLGAPLLDIQKSFGSWNLLTCASADKEVSLDGIFLSSNNSATKGPQPTFVMVHGGPTGRDCPEFEGYYMHWASYVLARGYSVLLPQYRGSSGRGEKFAMYSFGGIGKYDHSDVVAITDNAIKSGFVDSERVMIGGWSQGGFLTYLAATRNGLQELGWKFQAGVAGAGVSDVDALVLTDDLGLFSDPELMGGRVQWTLDQYDTRNRSASALWEVKAAVDKAKELGTTVIPPMLLLHGNNDERCPPSQALGFHRALRYHNLPHEYVRYPRQDHGFTEQRFLVDMLMRIGKWCDRYIGLDHGKVEDVQQRVLPIRQPFAEKAMHAV